MIVFCSARSAGESSGTGGAGFRSWQRGPPATPPVPPRRQNLRFAVPRISPTPHRLTELDKRGRGNAHRVSGSPTRRAGRRGACSASGPRAGTERLLSRAGAVPQTVPARIRNTAQPAAGLTGCRGDLVANCAPRVGSHSCSYTGTLAWCPVPVGPLWVPGSGPPAWPQGVGAHFRSGAEACPTPSARAQSAPNSRRSHSRQ
jgi:hypothetical protein